MNKAQKVLKKVTQDAPSADPTENEIDAEECQRMVAEAAYYKAEKRGFTPGDEQADWFEAEREVTAGMSG